MNICIYLYIYRRANGIYIPKSCNLQLMDSLSLFTRVQKKYFTLTVTGVKKIFQQESSFL